MKLVVFAHTPPPHHGQSRMVKIMLDGLERLRAGQSGTAPGIASGGGGPEAGGRTEAQQVPSIECFHVNARVSDDLEDVGSMRWKKLWLLAGHLRRAIVLRFRHGIRAVYYIPTPPKKSSLLRDWIAMACLRPFFPRVIFHWHAVGLGEWLETKVPPWQRWLSHRLIDRASVSIALSKFSQPDSQLFRPVRSVVVTNGIPDPCPDYMARVEPLRKSRLDERRRLLSGAQSPATVVRAETDGAEARIVFLAHCTADKGLFDTIEGVRLAREILQKRGVVLNMRLTVVGSFADAGERAAYEKLVSDPAIGGFVRYAGFVTEEEKQKILGEADVFCFPTYFPNEGQPANLIEAMAFGLPSVVTRWRAIPEFLPDNYPGLIEPRQPGEVARALIEMLTYDGSVFRPIFLRHFTLDRHLMNLARAIATAETPAA